MEINFENCGFNEVSLSWLLEKGTETPGHQFEKTSLLPIFFPFPSLVLFFEKVVSVFLLWAALLYPSFRSFLFITMTFHPFSASDVQKLLIIVRSSSSSCSSVLSSFEYFFFTHNPVSFRPSLCPCGIAHSRANPSFLPPPASLSRARLPSLLL